MTTTTWRVKAKTMTCTICREKDREIARLNGVIAGMYDYLHRRLLKRKARGPRKGAGADGIARERNVKSGK